MGGRRRRRRFGRPPKHRVLDEDPGQRGFSPLFEVPADSGKKKIEMTGDEYEAYRLTEYLELNQDEAATRMNISRGTLWRILESAKKKLAKMIVEGRQLKIEGGHYVIGSEEDSSCPECDREMGSGDN